MQIIAWHVPNKKFSAWAIELADLMDTSSNQLAEILADWNTVLQQSKLAQTKPSNTNEGEQTDAPQAGKRLLRTRKRA